MLAMYLYTVRIRGLVYMFAEMLRVATKVFVLSGGVKPFLSQQVVEVISVSVIKCVLFPSVLCY